MDLVCANCVYSLSSALVILDLDMITALEVTANDPITIQSVSLLAYQNPPYTGLATGGGRRLSKTETGGDDAVLVK